MARITCSIKVYRLDIIHLQQGEAIRKFPRKLGKRKFLRKLEVPQPQEEAEAWKTSRWDRRSGSRGKSGKEYKEVQREIRLGLGGWLGLGVLLTGFADIVDPSERNLPDLH
ncbi:hypothetical protein J005_01374 [Cryptococcus neoformans]|nr:hypothetical protein J005_01374 [Cryptococcus neoformans var. grubii]